MTTFDYNIGLAEFVSDYLKIGPVDDSVEIAEAYVETALPAGANPTDDELRVEVNRLAEEINYYR
jgi:hypothetical protein